MHNGSLAGGASTYLFVGLTNQAMRRRLLLLFDPSADIPRGSEVLNVSLRLHSDLGVGNGTTLSVSVARLTQAWGEGTTYGGQGGGNASTPDSATWIHTFYPDKLWNTTGGSAGASSGQTTLTVRGGEKTISSQDLVRHVQDWIDGSHPNHGWLLTSTETAKGVVLRLHSRENGSLSLIPQLVVTYLPPPAPTTTVSTNTSTQTLATTVANASTTNTGPTSMTRPASTSRRPTNSNGGFTTVFFFSFDYDVMATLVSEARFIVLLQQHLVSAAPILLADILSMRVVRGSFLVEASIATESIAATIDALLSSCNVCFFGWEVNATVCASPAVNNACQPVTTGSSTVGTTPAASSTSSAAFPVSAIIGAWSVSGQIAGMWSTDAVTDRVHGRPIRTRICLLLLLQRALPPSHLGDVILISPPWPVTTCRHRCWSRGAAYLDPAGLLVPSIKHLQPPRERCSSGYVLRCMCLRDEVGRALSWALSLWIGHHASGSCHTWRAWGSSLALLCPLVNYSHLLPCFCTFFACVPSSRMWLLARSNPHSSIFIQPRLALHLTSLFCSPPPVVKQPDAKGVTLTSFTKKRGSMVVNPLSMTYDKVVETDTDKIVLLSESDTSAISATPVCRRILPVACARSASKPTRTAQGKITIAERCCLTQLTLK